MKTKYEIVIVEHFNNGREKEIVAEMELSPKANSNIALVERAIKGYRTKYTDFLQIEKWEVIKTEYQEVKNQNGEIKKVVQDTQKAIVKKEAIMKKIKLPTQKYIELQYEAVFKMKEPEEFQTILYEEKNRKPSYFTINTIVEEGYMPKVDTKKIKSKRIKELQLVILENTYKDKTTTTVKTPTTIKIKL